MRWRGYKNKDKDKDKEKILDSRFNMSGVTGERGSNWRAEMFDENRNCRITPSANPTYLLDKGPDIHGKLQPDAFQHGLKGGKARIAFAGQRSVQALTAQLRILSELSHASGLGNVA